jgi:hypothetical protein
LTKSLSFAIIKVMATDSLKKLDFMTPHDGHQEAVPLSEQREAAAKFEDLCTDVFMRYADKTKAFQPNGIASLHDRADNRFVIKAADDSVLDIWVTSNDTTMKEYTKPLEVRIQELDAERRGRKTVRYELERDKSAVKRFDVSDDMYEKAQLTKKIEGEDSASKISVEGLTKLIADLENEEKNQNLEESMGLNNQPVGVAEIDALANLITSSEPVSVDRY